MFNILKRFIIILLFLNITMSVFATGNQDRRRMQSFGAIQLKVVNLTDSSIYLYLNRLYIPSEIKSQEEYITENMLVSHQHFPLENGIPSFIGIQYSNNENIIIYRFRHNILSRIFLSNNQYIVVVNDSNINFIEKNIDDEIDYLDESLYQEFPWIDWNMERLGQHSIEFKIKNNSGSRRVIWIYTVQDELITLVIENGMTENIIYDHRILELGGIRLQVVDSGYTVENINIRNFSTRNPDGAIYPSTIEIILNSNGHSINYKDYVSWWDVIRNRPYQNFFYRNN